MNNAAYAMFALISVIVEAFNGRVEIGYNGVSEIYYDEGEDYFKAVLDDGTERNVASLLDMSDDDAFVFGELLYKAIVEKTAKDSKFKEIVDNAIQEATKE